MEKSSTLHKVILSGESKRKTKTKKKRMSFEQENVTGLTPADDLRH
jgi:hypothetical protein